MTPQPTRLVLTRPHTHAGKSYEIGARIEVDADTADWLVAHDIATRDTTTPAKLARTETDLPPIQRKEPKP
jgi:hypothetical protein